jgi:hypothetical protein
MYPILSQNLDEKIGVGGVCDGAFAAGSGRVLVFDDDCAFFCAFQEAFYVLFELFLGRLAGAGLLICFFGRRFLGDCGLVWRR